MRWIVVAVGTLFASASGVSANEYFWVSSTTDEGATASLVGCNECDDISVQLECVRESRVVRITLFSNYSEKEPSGNNADRVFFHFNGKKTARSAAYRFDEMNAGWLPTVTVNMRDPLLRRFNKLDSITVEANGRKSDISLDGAKQHLRKMRRGCR